jgi:hypothetical protein
MQVNFNTMFHAIAGMIIWELHIAKVRLSTFIVRKSQ